MKNFRREPFPINLALAHYNISQMIYFRKQTVAWPMSVQQRDSHSRQVQRTESFNLIFRFGRITTIYVVRRKNKRFTTFLIFLVCSQIYGFSHGSRRPIRSRARVYFSSRSVSPGLSQSALVFSPFPRSRSSFWAPSSTCFATYFHARTRRLHLLKAIHYDSKIISWDSSRRWRGRHPIKSYVAAPETSNRIQGAFSFISSRLRATVFRFLLFSREPLRHASPRSSRTRENVSLLFPDHEQIVSSGENSSENVTWGEFTILDLFLDLVLNPRLHLTKYYSK